MKNKNDRSLKRSLTKSFGLIVKMKESQPINLGFSLPQPKKVVIHHVKFNMVVLDNSKILKPKFMGF